MRRQDRLQIDWLQEVIAEDLLPAAYQMTLEHIAELGKALDIVQVDCRGIRDEIHDRSIERELNSQGVRILVDLGLVFDMRIVALQLLDLGELCLSVPFPR